MTSTAVVTVTLSSTPTLLNQRAQTRTKANLEETTYLGS